MPRNKKAGRQRGRERNKRTKEEWEAMKKANPELDRAQSYQLAPKSNTMFERFYEGIGIVPEGEWELFMKFMRQPLPTTFRVTGSRSQAQELLKLIKGKYFSKFISTEDGSQKVLPMSLPWYPDELAWQIDFTKKEIKNNNTLKSLHGFLISETESGNISRQEAVSMLPPLLMDIQPHHKILDMCAAPGSKTAQLIEMLHGDESVPVPEGFVVANDMDNKRCYLMTHQVKRIQSPNCMIINHDARILPNMKVSADEDAEFVKYDRVLCDVPCSGDGTMRKNPDIWKKWHVNGGYNLHRIQKKVLQRGLELLAVGGRLVYSTCSLNPIEDEAVILTLIKQCDGAIELVDVSDQLQGLKYSKGTYSWKLMTKQGQWCETMEQTPESQKDRWDSTMYPPLITEAQDAKLERCIRVLPYQQNTGAFFIAVLQKKQELPWVSARNRTLGPIINPRVRMDETESNTAGSEHFAFSVKSTTGLYMYAKCLLCEKMLQGRNDYTSHSAGRKHRMQLEEQGLISGEAPTSETVKTETDTPGVTNSDNTRETNGTCGAETSVEMNEAASVGAKTVSESAIKMEEGDAAVNSNSVKVSINVESSTGSDSKGPDAADSTVGSRADGSESPPPKKMKLEEGVEGEDGTGTPSSAKKMAIDRGDEIRVKIHGHREDPFIFCSRDDPIWPAIREFYEISENFGIEQIMYRNMKRVLYYVSKPVRNLVICNDERVKFINLGVKCFSNAPSPLVPDCDYRLSQEGLQAIQVFVKGRRVTMCMQDVVTILSSENPFICKLSTQAQEQVYAMDAGSAIFQFTPSESDPEPNVEIIFCGWRGKTSVRSFVGKDERAHYLRMCGVELSDIQLQKAEKKSLGDLSTDGTATPVGVASGDEAEVTQWNDGDVEPRGTEADEQEAPDDAGDGKPDAAAEGADITENTTVEGSVG